MSTTYEALEKLIKALYEFHQELEGSAKALEEAPKKEEIIKVKQDLLSSIKYRTREKEEIEQKLKEFESKYPAEFGLAKYLCTVNDPEIVLRKLEINYLKEGKEYMKDEFGYPTYNVKVVYEVVKIIKKKTEIEGEVKKLQSLYSFIENLPKIAEELKQSAESMRYFIKGVEYFGKILKGEEEELRKTFATVVYMISNYLLSSMTATNPRPKKSEDYNKFFLLPFTLIGILILINFINISFQGAFLESPTNSLINFFILLLILLSLTYLFFRRQRIRMHETKIKARHKKEK